MDSISKTFSIVIILATATYSIWLFEHFEGVLGAILFVNELLLSSTALLFIFNHWTQDHTYEIQKEPRGSLDVFITVVNEPLSIFAPTLEAAAKIKYKNKKLYVLDDGGREDIQKIAGFYGATYVARTEKVHRKAGNLNCGFAHSSGEFILVLDADQVALPNIAQDLLGYFRTDKKIAIVSTRQMFDVPENDFNHDTIFYQYMQAGKNANNAAISCGSGVFYKRSALKKIGGFQTWNIVEDLYTSYVLHCEGYTSIYINRPYTLGTAPMDIPMIYKQRGTWALDTMRLFFKKSPFTKKKLSFRQKIHYFEMAWFYIVPALAISILFLLPAIALFFDIHMLSSEVSYLVFRIILLLLVFSFFFRLNDYSLSSTQYWAALSFVFLYALIKAAFSNDMRYRVTEKSSKLNIEVKRILPHLAYVVINITALAWNISYHGSSVSIPFVAMNAVWILFMCICFLPILRKGLFPNGFNLRKKAELPYLEEPLDLLKYRTRTVTQ